MIWIWVSLGERSLCLFIGVRVVSSPNWIIALRIDIFHVILFGLSIFWSCRWTRGHGFLGDGLFACFFFRGTIRILIGFFISFWKGGVVAIRLFLRFLLIFLLEGGGWMEYSMGRGDLSLISFCLRWGIFGRWGCYLQRGYRGAYLVFTRICL